MLTETTMTDANAIVEAVLTVCGVVDLFTGTEKTALAN
jgi:hypothetical protein